MARRQHTYPDRSAGRRIRPKRMLLGPRGWVTMSGSPLVGKWFLSFGAEGVVHCGQILSALRGGRFIVQHYESSCGTRSYQEIVPLARMEAWALYPTARAMPDAWVYQFGLPDDVVARLGLPGSDAAVGDPHNLVGAEMVSLAKQGVIQRVGYVPSQRPRSRKGLLALYKRNEDRGSPERW